MLQPTDNQSEGKFSLILLNAYSVIELSYMHKGYF